MPVKNATKRPEHVIEEAVKRFLAGESAVVLAKYYKISKPGFYLWVKKYKENLLANSKRAGMSGKDLEAADANVLKVELEQLRLENRRLRDALVSSLLKEQQGGSHRG